MNRLCRVLSPLTPFALLPAFILSFFSLLYITSCSGGNKGSTAAPPASAGFPSAITLTSVATGFDQPLYVIHAGDGSGRLFVVEKKGVIRIVSNGVIQPSPFLDISQLVRSTGSEQGLLGLAFPPAFAQKNYFYVDYTSLSGIGDTIVARYPLTSNPNIANSAGGVTILSVPQPFTNHNGGQLAFGPDGFLYIGMGDGGSSGDPSNNAQNRSRLLGKILRINVESAASPYATPSGNPFANEVWAYGLRNPWRFSFDRSTGDLYIADVGQALFEEVDFQPAAGTGGENYGWNIMEGAHCFGNPNCDQTGLILPVTEYGHEGGDCSITGGFVYRGAQYPALQGIYLYGDFCSGKIWGLKRNGSTWESRLLLDSTLGISSFGEDEAGNVYVVDFEGGGIYKVDLP